MPEFRLVLEAAGDPGLFRAYILDDDGDRVGESDPTRPQEAPAAAHDALRDTLALVRLRPPTSRRGPHVTVLADQFDGWPLSNLHADGCKHSILADDDERWHAGEALRCAKCDALLVPIVHRDPKDHE